MKMIMRRDTFKNWEKTNSKGIYLDFKYIKIYFNILSNVGFFSFIDTFILSKDILLLQEKTIYQTLLFPSTVLSEISPFLQVTSNTQAMRDMKQEY